MAVDFLKIPYNTGPPPVILEYSAYDMAQISANAELTVFLQLRGRKMGCFQLGSCLHRFFKLDGRVEVREHGHCRYSAKFSSQRDYDRATQRSSWQISDHYFVEVYKWQPNFQFGKVPLLGAGDYLEARLEGLPVEYCIDNAVVKIGNAVCEPLGCPVFMVDTSKGKPARFWFQLIDSKCCLDLPLHVQIAGGPLVGLAYSRAQQCYHCGRFGHFRKCCPELNQQTRSLNRATISNSGPIQVHHRHLDRKPVPVSDLSPPTSFPEETRGGVKAHESILQMSSEESQEGTMSSEESQEGTMSSEESSEESQEGTMSSEESHEGTTSLEGISVTTPFSPIGFFARSTGSTSPARPIEETEMRAKCAMLVENGRESRPKLYNIGEEVCEIDVAVKVTHLNDQRGNQRRVTITPRAGYAPRCSKKLLYTTIEDAEDRNAIRALKDTCDENNVSMAIVFDKSSVLINDNQIVRCFGFSASHCADMTFRSFRSDGHAMDVKGNCLLMWNREELRVNVSPVLYGNAELLSQHLEFSASWVVDESDSDESSNGFSSSEGEGSIDSSVSSDESSRNGDTDLDESSLFSSSSGEGLSSESSTSSSSSSESSIFLPNGAIDSEGSSLFSSSGEGLSNESSTSSSSISESSIFLPNGDTDSDESSLFLTDAEEISNGSSAPSISEEGNESFVLSSNGE